jgi:HD-GYP domain-containing protein (c-di-GMP phosphodiesterase class II)
MAIFFSPLNKEENMESIVQVLEKVMAARDPYTVIHQQGVAKLSLALAREKGLEEKQTHNLVMAARLHDFGKISVPIGILSRPGKLSVHEFAIIKNHPMVGVDLLKQLTLPMDTFMTIMQHHERINGTGYPFGLSGEDILLEAKILGVADVVEAMATNRPYRPSLGIERALEEIFQKRGVLYDPAVVDALKRLDAAAIWNTFTFPKVSGYEADFTRRAA